VGSIALFVRVSEDDRVIEGCRLLQGDINAQGIAEPSDVKLDLLRLRQRRVAAGQGDEALGVVVHRTYAPQHGELADGAVGEWRPEPRVHELHELRPSRPTAIELHSMEPQLCVFQQIESGKRDPLVLRCAAHMEISHTAIEPWEGTHGNIARSD
jgi:hypothetical protein